MTQLNNIAETLIATFAKNNKVSKLKLTALVEECVSAQMPAVAVAKAHRRGRKPMDSLAVITAIREQLANTESKNFTVATAQKIWDITYIGAVKRMEKLEEAGLAKRVGHNTEQAGMGRKADLWAFN